MKPRFAILLLALMALTVRAEAVRNGNELALNFVRADPAGKTAIRAQSEGKLHTFRFLKVFHIEPAPETAPRGTLPVLHTTEPSSAITVIIHPQGAVSRNMVATVATNDAVAVNGRLASLAPPDAPTTFVVRPAVVRHKDRLAPKGEKELLHEIDPNAVKSPPPTP